MQRRTGIQVLLLQMVLGSIAGPIGGDGIYQDQYPTVSLGSQTFTMDAQSGAYTFGYDTGVDEHQSYRVETRSPDGTVTGRYGYIDPMGVLRVVDYVADHRGFRPILTTRYPVTSTSVIGPIPSPIITEESRLKTKRIPIVKDLVTASLVNQFRLTDLSVFDLFEDNSSSF